MVCRAEDQQAGPVGAPGQWPPSQGLCGRRAPGAEAQQGHDIGILRYCIHIAVTSGTSRGRGGGPVWFLQHIVVFRYILLETNLFRLHTLPLGDNLGLHSLPSRLSTLLSALQSNLPRACFLLKLCFCLQITRDQSTRFLGNGSLTSSSVSGFSIQ